MRILMLTDLYPPFIGGLELHVRNLSHGLAGRGHQVVVATMAHADLPSTAWDQGVQVHRFRGSLQRAGGVTNPSGRPYLPPFPDPEIVAALRRLIGRFRPSIVHAHNWMLHSFLPLKKWSGARLVVTLHDYGVVCAKRALMYGGAVCSGPGLSKCLRCAARHYGTGKGMGITLSNWATQRAQWAAVDMYLPVSRAVALGNELSEHSAPFQVIPNFVPDDIAARADPAHPVLADLPGEPFLSFVGALSRAKGIDVLLSAYEALSDAPPLVLIGTVWPDTPERFPPNTSVIHDAPHPAVMAAMRRSTVNVVPSVFPDPCPTVVMEAMASGLPVVASRIGGLPDLVTDGETGLLVPAGRPTELREALQRLIADPSAAKRMGEAGRERVRLFSATPVIDRIERVYAQLQATGQSDRGRPARIGSR